MSQFVISFFIFLVYTCVCVSRGWTLAIRLIRHGLIMTATEGQSWGPMVVPEVQDTLRKASQRMKKMAAHKPTAAQLAGHCCLRFPRCVGSFWSEFPKPALKGPLRSLHCPLWWYPQRWRVWAWVALDTQRGSCKRVTRTPEEDPGCSLKCTESQD